MAKLRLIGSLLVLFLLLKTEAITAQSVTILSEGFDNGTTPPPGWTFRGLGTYTTTAASGLSAPSLRFDDTGDQLITPTFSNADSLYFWLKGYSADAASTLHIEALSNGSWSTLASLSSISGSGITYALAVPASAIQLRFTYQKSAGNLAFDDLRLRAIPKAAISLHSGSQQYQSGSTYSFGSVLLGQAKQQSFTIRNSGAGTLALQAPALSGSAYAIAVAPAATVAPGDSTTFTLNFSPTTTGSISGSLTLSSNAANASTIALNLSGSGISSNNPPNGNFAYQNGDLRTTAGGSFSGQTSGLLEQYQNGSWMAVSNLPAGSTLFVLHNLELQGQYDVAAVTVADQAQLTLAISGQLTTQALTVKSGGFLLLNGLLISNGTFTAEDKATVEVNFAFSDPASQLWNGTENFHPNSLLKISNWNHARALAGSFISSNSAGYYFGNLTIGTSLSSDWSLTGSGSHYLTAGTFTLQTSGSRAVNLTGEGVSALFFEKDLKIESGLLRVHQSLSGQVQANVKGNLILSSGTLQLNGLNNAAASAQILLSGDLITAPGTVVNNSNTAGMSNSGIYFTGSTEQTISAASAFTSVPLAVKNGSAARFAQSLLLHPVGSANAGTFSVESNATLDFGFNSTGNANTISGNGYFRLEQGGTLKITSPEGISTAGATGNVQVTDNRRTFSNQAIFWYTGTAAQQTGTGLLTTTGGKVLIIDNPVSVTLTQNTGISNNTAVSPDGGRLEIRQGEFITGIGGDVTSSGRLVMRGGKFKTFTLNATVPQLTGSYDLTGGAVELAGNGTQTLRGGSNFQYHNVIVSGTNTAGSDSKTISTATTIKNQLEITGHAILDIGNRTLAGDAGLKMTGGTFRIGKTTGTLPELSGNASIYDLTGGTIELYGTTGSQSQSIRGSYGSGNLRLSYANLLISSNAVVGSSFDVNGTLTVNAGGTLNIGSNRSIGGNGNFTLLPNATLFYGAAEGITMSGTGINDGNIRVAGSRNYSTQANYGLTGGLTMQSGNGLPAQVNNLVVDKSSNAVTLSNTVQVNGTLTLQNGILATGTNEVFLANSSPAALAAFSATSYVNGNFRRSIGGTGSYTFPVGNEQGLRELRLQPENLSGNGFSSIAATFVPLGETGTVQVQEQDLYYSKLAPEGKWLLQPDHIPASGSYTLYASLSGFQNLTDNQFTLLNRSQPSAEWAALGAASGPDGDGRMVAAGYAMRTGLTSFGEFAIASATGQPLPVTWHSFTARAAGNEVLLNWSTVCETDNAVFEVERSTDGILFSRIGEKAGAGNSRQLRSYSFTDHSPVSGTGYYRIRQRDWNGKESFTPVVAVQAAGKAAMQARLFPNPAREFSVLEIHASMPAPATIMLFDASGKAVKTVKADLLQGLNQVHLNTAQLQPGLYVVKIATAEMNLTLKLIRQ